MSITDRVLEKMRTLSAPDQEKVLEFVELLGQPPVRRKDLRGMFADRGVHISLEDIQEARREAWANFPRDFPEGPGS